VSDQLMAGTHNLAVIIDGNIAHRRGISEEDLFTEVALQIRHIPGVKSVYAYELSREEPTGLEQPAPTPKHAKGTSDE
jgi:hypothetical protein